MANVAEILGVSEKHLSIRQADGSELRIKLRPLTFRQIAMAEERFQAPLSDWVEKVKYMKNVIFLVWLVVSRDMPTLTEEEVGDWFSVDNQKEAGEVLKVIFQSSGLEEKNTVGTTNEGTAS